MSINEKIDEMELFLEDVREELIRVKLVLKDVLASVKEQRCSFQVVPFVAQHTVVKEPPFFKESVDGLQ